MVRIVRSHTDNVSGDISRLAPKRLHKQEFGRRLMGMMLEKGWNQSELARQAGITRDGVSTYINGVSLPTPQSLDKLAKALGVEPADLLPNYKAGAIEADYPSFELRASSNPNEAWLRVDRLVSTKTALAVAALLNEDPLAQGEKK